MQFKIVINIDNSAFGETHAETAVELARILADMATRLEYDAAMERIATRGPLDLRDVNGNRVGFACLEASSAEKRMAAKA